MQTIYLNICIIHFSEGCLNKYGSFVTYWSAGIRRSCGKYVWQNHLEKRSDNICTEDNVEYNRWTSMDPNNFGGKGNCIQLRWSPSGFIWVDQKCLDKACVICELIT